MNIPITLISYSLSNKIVNQFRLYLYMKKVTSGQFKLDEKSMNDACDFLEIICSETFFKNLDWLVKNKWVTVNSYTNSYRVISFTRLCHKLRIPTQTGVVFETDDFRTFRPFLYAAVIAWQVRRKDWVERQPVRKEGRTSKSMPAMKAYFPKSEMPNRYLAKVLDLDYSTVSKYKKAAARAGYIRYSHQYRDTGYSKDLMYCLKQGYPDEAGQFLVRKGTIHRQLPDVINNALIRIKKKQLRAP